MKIIKNRNTKDYYDYLESMYGIDDLVVYDRREYTPIKNNPNQLHSLAVLFSNEKLYNDRKKRMIRSYSRDTLLDMDGNYSESHYIPNYPKMVYEGDVRHFCLEVGYIQYFFEVERYLDDNDELILETHLLKKKRVDKKNKFMDCPMSISMVNGRHTGNTLGLPRSPTQYKNPILKDTWVVKFIPADEMWKNLYEYLSSLRDKEFVDNRTNDEHIESNGFDKITSFRNIK